MKGAFLQTAFGTVLLTALAPAVFGDHLHVRSVAFRISLSMAHPKVENFTSVPASADPV